MKSNEIQAKLNEWLVDRYDYFTAPYGILLGNATSKKGTGYLTITFGCARTLDATIMIFNEKYMIYKSNRGDEVFKSFPELMTFLENNFPGAQKKQ